MTSTTARENREWVVGIPGTEFLEKPLSPRNLLARIAQLGVPGASHEPEEGH
jgi:DNA-binding response OmpR family regulator